MAQDISAHIAQTLATQGWCVTPNFIDAHAVQALAAESELFWNANKFREALIGAGRSLQSARSIRGDFICWLDTAAPTPAQLVYTQQLEQLRLVINRNLFIGVFEIELHLARYPAHTHYRKHLDRHTDTPSRQGLGERSVSCILYLNEDWHADDGGQLRLYLAGEGVTKTLDIIPTGGTLVTFLSADFYHEVLPARRPRLSITGWMRTRP